MPINSVFSRIFVPQVLESDTEDILQEWFPTYIQEVESQVGLTMGTVVPPVNYTSRNKYDALKGEELPKCVVKSPGLVGVPTKDGQGKYRATWRLGIGLATVAPDEATAQLNAQILGMAAVAIMLQEGGSLGYVSWVDWQSSDLPIQDQLKQYRAISAWFTINVQNVVTHKPGPAIPNAEPYSNSIADTVSVV